MAAWLSIALASCAAPRTTGPPTTAPTENMRNDLGRIAIERILPEPGVQLIAPARGAFEGFGRGLNAGAMTGFFGGWVGLAYGGAAGGPMALAVPFAAAAAGAPVGAVVGAFDAPSAEAVDSAEQALRRAFMAETRTAQEAFEQVAAELIADRTRVRVAATATTASADAKLRLALTAEVLGAELHPNPSVPLKVQAVAELVRSRDGAVLYRRDHMFIGHRHRTFLEWADDIEGLRIEMDQARRYLASAIVEEVFLLYLPAAVEPGDAALRQPLLVLPPPSVGPEREETVSGTCRPSFNYLYDCAPRREGR